MNIANPSRKGRRDYDNSLREEQARQTRERILEAALEGLSDPRTPPPTLADVALQAGVSEPTLYRHFGTRENLLEELARHAHGKLGMPSMPDRLDELPAQVQELYRRFQDQGDVIRVITRAGLGTEAHAHGARTRFGELRRLLGPETDHLGAGEGAAVAALFRVLFGFETWRRLVDELGVAPGQAGPVAAWAAEALVEKLRRDREAGRTHLTAAGDEANRVAERGRK